MIAKLIQSSDISLKTLNWQKNITYILSKKTTTIRPKQTQQKVLQKRYIAISELCDGAEKVTS